MPDKNVSVSFPLPLSSILFIIFLVLKLTGHITWSWLWVFSPLWISAAIVLLLLVALLLIAGVTSKTSKVRFRRR